MVKENKDIINLFVEREVLADVTDFVEYVLDTATDQNCPPFNTNSIETITAGCCPECGATEEFLDFHTITLEETAPVVDESASPDERYQCPHCGAGYPTMSEAAACCAGEEIVICENCGEMIPLDEYQSLCETSIGDVFEWLLVTPWLAQRLSEMGEIMIPEKNIWGRTNAVDVADDSAIVDICNDIGILKGQPHDWSAYLSK